MKHRFWVVQMYQREVPSSSLGPAFLFKVGGLEASVLGGFTLKAGLGDLRNRCVKDLAERCKGEVKLLDHLLGDVKSMLSNPVCWPDWKFSAFGGGW